MSKSVINSKPKFYKEFTAQGVDGIHTARIVVYPLGYHYTECTDSSQAVEVYFDGVLHWRWLRPAVDFSRTSLGEVLAKVEFSAQLEIDRLAGIVKKEELEYCTKHLLTSNGYKAE